MQAIIDKISQQVDSAELFKINYQAIPVSYEMNQLKSIDVESGEGWALRIINQGKIGFSSCTGQDQLEKMIEKSIEISEFGQRALFDFPGKINSTLPLKSKLFDPSIERLTVEEMIETGQDIIQKVHAIHPELRCDVDLAKQETFVQYWNSNNLHFDYKKSMFTQAIMVQRTLENDMMMIHESQAWGKHNLNIDTLLTQLEKKYNWADRIVEVPTGNLPVIFTPKAVLVLLLPLIRGLNSRMVNKKISPLQDKVDHNLWSPLLILLSDGLIDFAAGSAPYDDEGVPMARFPLIEKGVLKSYYYDLQNAAEAGERSTGNGIRSGYNSSPSPGISNLIIQEGKTSLEDMIKYIKEGIIVDQVLGLGQGNVLSGSFSNNVQLGFKIKDGKVVGRIKNVMIAGNAIQLLKDIGAVGNQDRWIPGQYQFQTIYIK
mgnify:CR=1 FL=1